MNLTDIEAALRLDLFDPVSSTQRWSTNDLDRAIDKAVLSYSHQHPNIAFVDMQAQPYQRTYAYPQSWNPAYPLWWIERILFPLQIPGTAFAAPNSALTASASSGGGLSSGVYQYGYTFLTPGGETLLSPLSSVTTGSGLQRVTLSNIATGSANPGTAGNTLLGRNLYRTLVGGGTLYLLATLGDTSSSGYSDSTPDSVLSTRAQAPGVNSSGIMSWPPRERAFVEYAPLFSDRGGLASGGNMGTMGAVGSIQSTLASQSPGFTLQIPNGALPVDTTQVMRVFYATRHQLDASGSSIPEAHREIVILGACAYAIEAYQVPTNDNFSFQDGTLHDQLDDTAIPQAWRALGKTKREQFESRLRELAQERVFSARVHWNRLPYL